ncbi:MAG TPA: GvpL/GvpF family gas vesicle protein [Candidatus Limnocylindria bacterium]|jgi:hypothetical protein|nr:GvpL/GvpF family gas vesicle protein [Candidatus Limnocylindria bacterium]
MSLLLRAIVASADQRIADDAGLVAVASARVAALASPWERARAASEPELLDHHRIVQAVFERVACLPARFGSVFADESALRARLLEREDELASRLAALGHRCELAITCAWRDTGSSLVAPREALASGRAYLERGLERSRARRTREQRAGEIVDRLLAELPVDRAFIRHEACPRPAVAVSMSVLVTRDEIGEITSRLERLGARLPDVTTVVQGPWAPYTFAVSA